MCSAAHVLTGRGEDLPSSRIRARYLRLHPTPRAVWDILLEDDRTESSPVG